jgi:heat shock protein 4
MEIQFAGEDATKSAYVARLDGLKTLGDPIQLRYREHDDRPRATAQFREIVTGFADKANNGDEKYAHIDAKDLNTVIEACANAEAWLGNKLASQAEKALDVKPVITSSDLKKKQEE